MPGIESIVADRDEDDGRVLRRGDSIRRREVRGSSSESHGIVGAPVYAEGAGLDRATLTGKFSLDAKSPGRDRGQVIPNFTDGYGGSAPDMGAQEAGTPRMQFGVGHGDRPRFPN